jgi:hypothetical protein
MSVLTTISGVSNTINLAGSALSLVGLGAALIKEKNPPRGIAGFLFDIAATDNVTHAAQITDHYVENNSSIQDHIAFDPVKITITGKIGELVYTKNQGLAFLSAAIDRLTPLGVLKPSQSLQAQRYIAAVDQLGSALTSAKKVFNDLSSIFDNNPAKNAQQKAFERFETYFFGRTLLTVETPWKTYDSMVIENWTADQDAESMYETNFTLTFKQVRFVGTKVNVGKLVGRIKEQKQTAVDQGNTKGISFLANTTDKVTNQTGAPKK